MTSVSRTGWGTAEPTPESWHHGPWAVTRSDDELADVSFHDRTVLRSVRAVVRDRDWRTVPPTVESVEETHGGLRLRLRFAEAGIDIRGELVVSAVASRLTTALTLRAHSAFERNRIGLVVLHPAEVAGSPLSVEHVDGTRTATRFPRDISPHQPAMDIRSLSWAHRGVTSTLDFEGDVFEMEDQRNWTDASFKTYSTPLGEPFPVLVRPGDEIRQQVDLVCEQSGGDVTPQDPAVVDLALRGGRLPVFTLGASTGRGSLPPADATVLVELEAERPHWRDQLSRAVTESGSFGLDVRIVADRAEVVRDVVDELVEHQRRKVAIVRLGVFSTTTHATEPDTWIALRDRVGDVGLATALIGGTRAHFTELNRGHLHLPLDLPALTFSSTPQMHASESRQVVESVDMQRLTATAAVRIAAGRPVHIGPVTLRPRFNAVATTPPGRDNDDVHAADDPDATDPRQSSAALAAWAVASAAAFSPAGVASVSFFEASGPRGLRTVDGTDFPVRHAMRQVLELSGVEAVDPVESPDAVHVLAGVVGQFVVALVANLRDQPVSVTLRFDGEEQRLSIPALEHRRCTWRAGPQPSRP